MRIRIMIEYDLDVEDGAAPNAIERDLESEKRDWRNGSVDLSDIEALEREGMMDAKVTWEIVP